MPSAFMTASSSKRTRRPARMLGIRPRAAQRYTAQMDTSTALAISSTSTRSGCPPGRLDGSSPGRRGDPASAARATLAALARTSAALGGASPADAIASRKPSSIASSNSGEVGWLWCGSGTSKLRLLGMRFVPFMNPHYASAIKPERTVFAGFSRRHPWTWSGVVPATSCITLPS